MTKQALEKLKADLLEKLLKQAQVESLPGRLAKLEETHKRLNAVERCLASLPAGTSKSE